MPFPAFLGPLLSGGMGALGGIFGMGALNDGRNDILGLPGQDPIALRGNFGSSFDGNAQLGGDFLGAQSNLGALTGLMGGGLFNDTGLQTGLAQNDIAGALGQADSALQQQASGSAFGGLGGLFNQTSGLAGLFGQGIAQGPQDLTGGLQSGLFGQGFANQLAAGDQSALFNQSLNTQRQAASGGLLDTAINRFQDRQFAQGRLGSTGGGVEQEAFLNSLAQQDLGFQNNAFGQAQQQQNFLGNLGNQQLGLGANLFGQNLGQFNQNVGQFQGLTGLASGLEGQAFGQNMGALQQNQSAGMNRINNALGFLGSANDIFGSNVGLGLQAAGGLLDFGAFGRDTAALPFQLQAGLLGAGGQHADALARMSESRAGGMGGLFGGIGSALGSIFSDVRLKTNIKEVKDGWYTWDWNDAAIEMGLEDQPTYGVIAQEVQKTNPEAVTEEDGYLKVNYGVLLNG